MTPDPRPPTYSVPIFWQGRKVGIRITHDGPHVYVDGVCSCGVLDLGLVR